MKICVSDSFSSKCIKIRCFYFGSKTSQIRKSKIINKHDQNIWGAGRRCRRSWPVWVGCREHFPDFSFKTAVRFVHFSPFTSCLSEFDVPTFLNWQISRLVSTSNPLLTRNSFKVMSDSKSLISNSLIRRSLSMGLPNQSQLSFFL